MVKVKFMGNDGKLYKYLVEGSDYVDLNSIRRIMSYMLPIYAVDNIDFYENDSVIVDEVVANRIGLCPLTTPLSNTGQKVTFKLEKQGPGPVYSGDLLSSDSDVKMVYDTILLTKLNENEKISLEAYAELGRGKDHTKYTPAIVSYAQLFSLNLETACKDCKEIYNKYSKDAIKVGKDLLVKPEQYDICMSEIEKCEKKCLKLNATNNYMFNIELIGQTNVKDLLKLTNRYVKEYVSLLKKKFK